MSIRERVVHHIGPKCHPVEDEAPAMNSDVLTYSYAIDLTYQTHIPEHTRLAVTHVRN